MSRDTIRVEGPDAAVYLQGQISQDVDAIGVGETAWSLVLQPNGKLASWFRIHRVAEQEFLLDTDEGYGSGLVARLERFKLRTDATIDVSDTQLPAPVTWPGAPDPSDERQRILAGMPKMGAELTDETIPGEGGQQLIDLSVSFTKGCYTGQELVARIDSRGGNVPRPIRVIQADGELAVGDEVRFDGDVVGVITSAIGDVALAPLMRRVEVGDSVEVGPLSARVVEPVGS